MTFWQFLFFFLYVRDWHTGKMELSRPRLAIFCGAIFFVLLALLLVSIMQAPVVYINGAE
ncbi:MAG: hypothetical protein MUF19_01705 [Candidatus Pacebacteria bacterium]|jgi:hypothetical protein|nr:hypothetical protein [Candidatus Paceibacterota bacterium]